MLQTPLVTAIGLLAAVCTTAAFVPQVVRIMRRRSAKDISAFGTSLLAVGTALWLAYGIALHSVPIVLANAVTFALNVSILVLKIRHR